MVLAKAVSNAGVISLRSAPQSVKKRYSELLSNALAFEMADGLRQVGFRDVKPMRGGPGEKEFQGGLGPKRVDVSYADERHGLLLAISIKTICVEPYGKNLKNRFSDLCTEAITLHMRFPYSVVCALFAMPDEADHDVTAQRKVSTFRRAMALFSTISGRVDHSSAAEKFENVTMMLFGPVRSPGGETWTRLYDAREGIELSEEQYLSRIRNIYNVRNPHAQVGESQLDPDGYGA